MLKFFNTLTRKKEGFRPLIPGRVTMYTCGPTVYDFAHIGNFRTYMFEDILRRYFEYSGYKVTQVMNLTDIDDKTIKNSRANKVALSDWTRRFKDSFFEDVKTLNIEPAEVYPEATKHIQEMTALIKRLVEKGFCYTSDGSIYFSIAKFKDYGRLSGFKLDELKENASGRVKSDEYEKENASDFVLWKAYDEDDGDVFWETEFGRGRPGWHIECSAMSMKYLGEAFDIHTGGVDNIFPHHENEIAQSQAATGKRFANYWLHSAHLIVEGEKMAKSKGNFFTLRDLIKKDYSPKAIRYLLLSTYYRKELNFTLKGLNSARGACERVQLFYDKLDELKCGNKTNARVAEFIGTAQKGFRESMDDDLNISEALSYVFGLIRSVNTLLEKEKISENDRKAILNCLSAFDKVLGIIEYDKVSIDSEVEALIEQRNLARREKRWADADAIREKIDRMGIVIEDTKDGVRWRRK